MQEKIEWNKIGKWLLATDEAKVATTIADKKFQEEFDEYSLFSRSRWCLVCIVCLYAFK